MNTMLQASLNATAISLQYPERYILLNLLRSVVIILQIDAEVLSWLMVIYVTP